VEDCRLVPVVLSFLSPYKQEVGGSIPSPPTTKRLLASIFGCRSSKRSVFGRAVCAHSCPISAADERVHTLPGADGFLPADVPPGRTARFEVEVSNLSPNDIAAIKGMSTLRPSRNSWA
jgi:hypothetical protein